MLALEPGGPTDLPGPPAHVYAPVVVTGSGHLGIPMAVDGLGSDIGGLISVGCPVAPPFSPPVLALGSWLVVVAFPAALHLPPAVRLRGLVPQAAGRVLPVPSV